MQYSIIVPAFNTADTLETAVSSILHCGLTDYEILLIDDGSQDRTPEICDALSSKYSCVRCIHQKNQGVSAARNCGLSRAQGAYIWFFDSDDQVDPGSMVRAAQVIEEESPDVLMFGLSFDYYHRDRIYERVEYSYPHEKKMTYRDLQDAFSELYYDNILTPCWNKVIRKSVLQDNKIGFDPELFSMEDLQFSLRMLQYCGSIYLLPNVIYRFRQEERRTKKAFGRDNKRMARIPDITEYLTRFQPLLADYREVLTGLYYMMLREKLSTRRPSEMAEIAEKYRRSPYSREPYTRYLNPEQRTLASQLKNGEYGKLAFRFRKERIRNTAVSRIKRSAVYRLLWGSSPKTTSV